MGQKEQNKKKEVHKQKQNCDTKMHKWKNMRYLKRHLNQTHNILKVDS